MKRGLIFAYGVLTYALFFTTLVYAIGFLGNVGVPKSIDSAPTRTFGNALLVDIALLALFSVQHSGMARPTWKRWLTRFIPAAAERSTYVLFSSICFALLMWHWEPLGGVVWSAGSNLAVTILTSLYFASWVLLLYATILIDHFDLFGLRQVWQHLRKQVAATPTFVTPALYRVIRHPIYLGWLGILWCTPVMSATHFLMAAGSTLYILLGIQLEERDLEALHPEYRQYKAKVPALIPSPQRRLRRRSRVKSV